MGALNLFADRPVRVGDLCRYDDDVTPGWRPIGRIESIGLRSTKVRHLDRSLITIPNADFAQLKIVNFNECDRMLLTATLGLRYETTDDQLRFLLASLRELLHAHPSTIHTADDPVRVRFVGFGDFSLNVAIRVYIRTKTRNEFLAIQEDILLRAKKLVEQAGTGFAFPSSTVYLGRDGGLDRNASRQRRSRYANGPRSRPCRFRILQRTIEGPSRTRSIIRPRGRRMRTGADGDFVMSRSMRSSTRIPPIAASSGRGRQLTQNWERLRLAR